MCSNAPYGKELITLVGNSWIICRSKSYAGRIYYFNTSTGDAVWNLSETEVEKAKNRTKILQSQSNFAIADCPEPQESPNDHSTADANQFSQSIVQPIICNKQIINNQLPVKSPTQCSNLQCNSMNPIPFDVPIVPTKGPALWNISPQQIFVTPTWSQTQPIIDNHNVGQVNINKADTLSNRFKKYAEKLHNHPKKTGVLKYKCLKRSTKSLGNQVQDNKNNVDLRLLLSLKRRENILNEKESHLRKAAATTYLKDKHSETKQDGTHHQPLHLREKIYGINPTEVEDDNDVKKWHENLSNEQGGIDPLSIYSRSYTFNTKDDDDDDDEWLDEENWNSQEDTNPVEAVRSVLEKSENYDIWYLVTDSNVLINNIHLLNNILKADKQCRLMVPQQVMNKIQSATNSRLRLLAHRTLYFIFRQVEANLAIIDKTNEEIINSNDAIFNCCVQLLEKGNRVVLLSDDIELHNNSNASNVQILTVSEIENLLTESKGSEISAENSDEQNSKLARGRNIKITIANETNIQHDEDKCIKPDKVLGEGISEIIHSLEKKACDVGVQADSVPSPKTIDDINNEITLPDSTKANDCISFNKIGVPRQSPQNLFPKMRNTDKKKIWQRHKLRHTISMTDYCATKVDESVTSICPVTNSNTDENAHYDAENSTWGLCSHTSAESLHKYSSEHNDMSSETSSLAAIRIVNPIENVTIEETNTSCVSNTTSIIDNGSEKSIIFHKAKKEDDKHVMFEVTDVRMEEFLKTKSDEWVSRLVQIMEEALSQVLRLEPSSSLEHMPPPWTVHEAAECVKKFHHDSDVIDAANKFLQISLENGGLRGKIKSSISPHKFMELYSYGVYLIDALQGVLVENEDLQTAAESLSKLLSDIQDPHLDPSSQGSFNDHSVQKNNLKVPGDNGPVNPDDNNEIEILEKNKKNESPFISPGKYNLRSKKSIKEKQDAADEINSTKNTDPESFFSCLFLKKNSSSTSNSEITSAGPNPNIGLGTSDDIQEKNRSPNLHQNKKNDTNSEELAVNILDEQPKVNEPKITRNFSICPEYEEKLKTKSEFNSDLGAYRTRKEFERAMIDYEEDFTEDYYGIEEGDMESGYCNMIPYDDKWYDFERIPEETDVNSSLKITKNVDINFNKTITFRHVMEKLEEDIRRAYSSIQDFCVKSCKSLQTPDINGDDKSQMRLRAEKTCIYIQKICDQLNSVLKRENSDNSIFKILKRKEFEDIIVNDDDVEVYRTFIGNCLEQGNILLDSVTLLLEASKEPTV